MDKNAIKKYAVWARRELISRVSQRAALYEITADGYGDQNSSSVHGRLMSAEEKKQRSALIAQIKEKGYEQVMEEIAYTWFNRFSALRFMEVNGYLPTRIRVFTNDDNAFKPQILDEAINIEMDGLDMQKVYELKNANDDDALFKYMIITQCNALSSILPGMFQRISDYTELLFPDNLLREGSVVEQMIAMIPQEDWTDQVQIIGWLYEYYNTEPKDRVFASIKKNVKITKENIPAATQLFTPDWIVRYMVENSLGRLWLEGHPNDDLKAEWKYYLDEAEQELEVQAQLTEIRKQYAALKPKDILAIDPCQGSGHILAYMFDVFVQIYEAYGYSAREAASSIVENNIWGLDIDERATQLAYFSVMMKARQYDRRFFSRGIQPHVYEIIESNNIDPHCIDYFVDGRKELKSAIDTLVKEYYDAKEYGSILNVTPVDFDALYDRFNEIENEEVPGIYSYQAIDTLLPLVQVAKVMTQQYDVVVTNPPYMGNGGMNDTLIDFAKNNYPNSRMDLFAMFIEKCGRLAKKNKFYAMITQPSFLYLSSFEKLRKFVINEATIISMLDMGRGIFGIDFGSTSFVIRKFKNKDYVGGYSKLYSRIFQYIAPEDIAYMYVRSKGNHRIAFSFDTYVNGGCNIDELFYDSQQGVHLFYNSNQRSYTEIPNTPFAYWVSNVLASSFKKYPQLGSVANIKHGMSTGNNDKVLRAWMEVNYNDICFSARSQEEFDESGAKFAPYNKGGDYRKWYGNQWYVIGYNQYYNDLMDSFSGHRHDNKGFYFREGFTWSTVSAGDISLRYSDIGYIFDSKGSMGFTADHDTTLYAMALVNSKVCGECLKILSPTIDYNAGSLRKLPFIESEKDDVVTLVESNIALARRNWDSFETSWGFSTHPLVLYSSEGSVEKAYQRWEKETLDMLKKLQGNEELLNQHFIDAYGLSDELYPQVDEAKVIPSCRPADLNRDIKSFISYAVGCMFGRYSLDSEGLIYAGGMWDESKYITYHPDKDGILPICDDEYFEDDIVGRFVKFVEVIYGDNSIEENLRFIANTLGGKGSPRQIIRDYFINDFYADHCNTYSITGSGKRPIYWLFDSGKKNGFKCLIYMHRYQPDTIARIRTDYVHEQQSRYRTAIADLESRVDNAGTGERVKLTKRLDSIKAQAEELRVYEEKIHHLADQMIRIDLDDGVKVNYAKFQDVLAKIK